MPLNLFLVLILTTFSITTLWAIENWVPFGDDEQNTCIASVHSLHLWLKAEISQGKSWVTVIWENFLYLAEENELEIIQFAINKANFEASNWNISVAFWKNTKTTTKEKKGADSEPKNQRCDCPLERF